MYAIIEVGAKQYTVRKGDSIEVEKIEGEVGKELVFTSVLLVVKDDTAEIGAPYVKGAKVKVEILAQTKAKKVISYKYRRRKSSHTKKGHRQKLTRIKILDISI